MPIENNPLRQYFRKPAIYLKLPTGGRQYKPGIVDVPENGELPIFPMTALDEITTKTPDALYSGQAIVDIVKSCVPAIKDPWKLTSIDLDAILIGIRTATEGNKQELVTVCPSCNEDAKYDTNLVVALNNINADVYNDELVLGDLSIKFRSMSYKDLNEMNKKQFEMERMFTQIDAIDSVEEKTKKTQEVVILVSKVAMDATAYSIEYIKTPDVYVDQPQFILDFIQNCDKQTFETIKDHNLKIKKMTEIKPLHIKCIHCGHEYDQPFTLNATDFFG